MRHFLISALLLSLVSGCSLTHFGPYRIDVQQGNAINQETVARLKIGLNRSQVRFLLGTPLLVDPFRKDRWDYVYMFYKAGKLTEQKHITLFFDGDTLVRMEGDIPPPAAETTPGAPAVPAAQPESSATPPALPLAAETSPAAPAPVAVIDAAPQGTTQSGSSPSEPVAATAAVASPAATPSAAAVPAESVASAAAISSIKTSVVPPLVPPNPSAAPKTPIPEVKPRPITPLSLQPDVNVETIQPDTIPPFPVAGPVGVASDRPVLKALNVWLNAWSRRDEAAYLAAYDTSFVPEGGGSRADWEARRRQLFSADNNIEIKISSTSVDLATDGRATVTFNQYYRSGAYHDSVVKQLRMIQHDGRWLITEEKVLSILHRAKS